MKEEELRVGNLVRLPQNKTEFKITVDNLHAANTYRPVKLTEERLEKFGFKLIERTDVFDCFNYPYFVRDGVIVLYNYTSEYNVCFKCGYAEMRDGKYYATLSMWVYSVHQLQNIYFALTGKELKIDK